jgi:hypothetical protein
MTNSHPGGTTTAVVNEGTETYRFKVDEETCWLVEMGQMGESYKPPLEDIPDSIIERVEAKTGRTAVPR